VKLTRRGEYAIAILATTIMLAVMGIAGWIEGGMQ